MTAAELIAELLTVPPDTQIRVYADHGQICMKASTACLQSIRKADLGEWMCETVLPHELEDDDDDGGRTEVVQVFEIGAP